MILEQIWRYGFISNEMSDIIKEYFFKDKKRMMYEMGKWWS